MSETFVEVVEISELRPHPNADRLEIAVVNGATVVVGKDAFRVGDNAAYFPPNMLIPDELANSLGVVKYLKHAVYNDSDGASQCRVSGCRLRGQPSYGFLAGLQSLPISLSSPFTGQDLSDLLGAKKYEPPVRVTTSDAASEHPFFHKYTDIENVLRYPKVIPEGTPVRITEKIHGTNSRVGMVRDGIGLEWQWMAGSHKLRRKEPIEGRSCMYWEPLYIPGVKEMLTALKKDSSAIIFGEVYGQGVQDLDYGVQSGKRGYRIFDVSIDGVYQPWITVESWCNHFKLETVPVLYSGPFTASLIEQYTHGNTTLGATRSQFKGREGIVVTPLEEKHSDVLGGRMILKSVSADYLDRKCAEDNE